MKPITRSEADRIERFLKTLSFRHVVSRRSYASILRGFLHFVSSYPEGDIMTVTLVRQWLRAHTPRSPLGDLCHHARLVDRFLEWSGKCDCMTSNPFAELRQQYGQRMAPIVRALLGDDPAAKLHQLRPTPRYGSSLGSMMRDHVDRMRSLGYRYERNERALLRFDRFLQCQPDLQEAPLRVLLDAWREGNPSSRHRLEVSIVGRSLSKAMRRLDPTVEVLPIDRDAARQIKRLQRTPHIYSEEDIRKLLETTKTFEYKSAPLRARSLYMMIILTYCAGLRIGELVRLTLADVDLETDTIEIRGTKFFKSRRLPIANGVAWAVRQYLAVRQQAGAPVDPESGLFWKEIGGGSYSYGGVRNLLVEVLRRAGLKPNSGKVGPRIHDLRHAMVCHRMQAWYRDGINPQSRLPHLATYLGHNNINSTLVYLTITQEQMQHASNRFRIHGAAALGSIGEQS